MKKSGRSLHSVVYGYRLIKKKKYLIDLLKQWNEYNNVIKKYTIHVYILC